MNTDNIKTNLENISEDILKIKSKIKEQSLLILEDKDKKKPNKSSKVFFIDFTYNTVASVIIFFTLKSNFSIFSKNNLIMALLLIILVISSLYLSLKKYAIN